MPKRFDCEPEPNEFMEMPCRCECGNWFDLNDGHRSNKGNKVICRECAEDQAALRLGDDVRFTEDCVINGKKRAEKGDKGVIVNKFGQVNNETSVRVNGKYYPINHVPVSILEKINY